MTNIGEYIAGAYYEIVNKIPLVLYNQQISYIFEENKIEFDGKRLDLNWNKSKLKKVFKDNEFDINRVEIDVIALGDCRIIAECTERNIENRSIENIRHKLYGAIAYDALIGSDTNLTLEIWAPKASKAIKASINDLEKELIKIHKKTDCDQSKLSLKLISDNIFDERIQEIIKISKSISANKLSNPFFRTLQVLNKMKVI